MIEHDTPRTTSSVPTPAAGRRRSVAAVLLSALLVLALGACGGDSDGDDSAATTSSDQSSSSAGSDDSGNSDDSGDSDESAAPALDLAPISDCIAAGDIVVAPTTFSEAFMSEQQLAGVLDLGALGIEFGGGQLFFYETVELADAKYAQLSDGTDAAVRQDGTAVLEYRSGVQEEAADIVMGCVAA